MSEVEGQEKTGAEDQPTFLESLGEDHKGNDLFTGLENYEQLAAKTVEINASLEELKSAQPVALEKAEDYTFEFPEGVEPNEEGVKAFQELAHGLKLSKDTAQALMQYDLDRQAKAIADDESAAKDALAKMKEDLGGNYDAGASLVKKVLHTFEGDEILSMMDDEGNLLGNSVPFFKFIMRIGAGISEDKLETPTNPGGGKTKKSAADTLYGEDSEKS